MRLLTYRVVGRAEQGKLFFRATAQARRAAADVDEHIGYAIVARVGGHGFVKEHPVERGYRDLRATGLMEGVLLV